MEGRAGRWEALAQRAPLLVRPVLLNIVTSDTSVAPKSLPAMGRFLLQRHLLKFAIPGLGLPLSIAVNPWLATVTGNQASVLFRREARILETARRITGQAVNHSELLWVLWLIVKADGVVHDNERLLLKHVAALVGDLNSELSALAGLDLALDFDHNHWDSPRLCQPRQGRLYQAGVAAAAVDGSIDVNELSRLKKIAAHCSVPFDANAVRKLAAEEASAA